MTEEKRDRIIAAATVNVILLVVILAAVIIYQVVVLAQLQARRRELKEEIEYYARQTEESEDLLERLQAKENLRDMLVGSDWHFED